jgi:hypothetical protein
MKKFFLKILVISFLSTIALMGQTTEGKIFWVGFMENFSDTNKIEISIFISSKNNTKGKVQIPFYKFEFEFKVTKDSTIKIIIPTEYAMALSSEIVEYKGIYIEAEDDINVFALNYKKYTSDATLIYPIDALGNDYTCIGYDGTGPNELLIVATEDDTEIDIYPRTYTSTGQSKKFRIVLNKGQTYQVKFNGDLTGTRVLSNNYPIAVFSGVLCTYVPKNIPACDHLYEQIPPSSAWGYKYGIVPLKTRKADTYRILSLFDNTEVYLNNENSLRLESREYDEIMLSDPTIISSNNPILVAQYSNGQNFDSTNSDPFLIVLSPLEQTRNNITFNAFTSKIIENYYLNIIVRSKDLNTLLIDSSSRYQTQFHHFTTDNKYVYAQLSIAQGNHTITCKGDGFIAYVYGYGNYESYGYNAGTRIEKINEFKFRIGAYANYNYLLNDNLSFLNFNNIPTCYRNYFETCDKNNFSLKSTFSASVGALIEIPSLLTTPFGIGARGGLSYSRLNFGKTEYAFENTALQRDLNNSVMVDILSFNAFPYLIFTFIEDLNLYTGINWTFNYYSNNTYEEKIEKFRNNSEINKTVYQNNTDFYDCNKQILSGVSGIGYEFVLNEEKSLRLSPEIFFFFNLISNTSQFDQYLHRLTIGLSFKWGY